MLIQVLQVNIGCYIEYSPYIQEVEESMSMRRNKVHTKKTKQTSGGENTIQEMKNTLDVINSKLDNAKEKVSELQTKEIVQSKMKQKKIELK